MDELINVREAALKLFLGARAGEVLNTEPFDGKTKPGPAIAAELKRAVNAFQAAAVDAQGKHVDYACLRQSEAYQLYRATLTPQLRYIDLHTLATREEQLAFWINLYNALVIDAVIAYSVQKSVIERMAGLAFFKCAAYNIGGLRFSCEDIEHGILRVNRGSPFVPGAQFKEADSRRRWMLATPDARIHFALNCASRSCPPIGVYTAEAIDEQLDLATRNFVAVDVEVNPARGELRLSQVFNWYAKDFNGPAGVVDFLLRYLPADERRAWLAAQSDIRLVHKPYDWGLNI
ncbi:MAG: DUF547 domain-containing protein [Chloroflexales bacterium]|nr:DUF547 domain-containing protein [Chloroflexales bacterium]